MKKWIAWLLALCLILGCLTGCTVEIVTEPDAPVADTDPLWAPGVPDFTVDDIPAYNGEPYVAVNDNLPLFHTNGSINPASMEYYAELDDLGRCGVTYACVGKDTMPTEKRGNISQVKPTGWQNAEYDHVDGKHLYNRCHLIGYQLTAENANKSNLITGTRHLNVDGMLPFENMVADYVKETGNHVAYRVTPIFDGDDLVAQGVLMEGWSVEDDGEGVAFCVFAYNVQPGVEIDYATGKSWESGAQGTQQTGKQTYVLNTSSKKFHQKDCSGVNSIDSSNKKKFTGDRQKLIDQGYEPCKRCNP